MARDYKNSTPAPRKKTVRKKTSRKTSKKTVKKTSLLSKLPVWFWFVAGILASFGLMWMKTNWFTADPVVEPKDMTPLSSRLEAELDSEPVNKEHEPKPYKLTKDPRFTFYERLPKDEIIIPQEALDIEVDQNKIKAPLETIEKAGSYILQAGSFQEFSDADRRKAELALLGLESNIQKVNIKKTDWFRVRVGPYTDLGQLNETRLRLRSGEIDVLVIRTQ